MALVVLGVGVAGALVLVLPLPDGLPRGRLADLSSLAAALLCTLCAARCARHSTLPTRRSWLALTAAAAAWTVGQLLWIRLNWTGTYSFPSPADAAFLLFPPLAGLALLLYPTDTGAHRLRRTLDAAMTGLAVGLIGWRMTQDVLGWTATGDNVLAMAMAVTYPALDILLLVLTLLTLSRFPATQLPLGLITSGLLTFVAADITFVYQQAAGDNPLNLIDAGWGLGFTCIALAALAKPAPNPDQKRALLEFPLIGLLLYLPVIGAMLVVTSAKLNGHLIPVSEFAVISVLVVLLLARQYLAMRQNWQLTRQLARREEQLRYQAFHDGLTGLANRALFRDRLEHAVELHARDLRPVSLLFLDLDDFKVVNDTSGHAAGDQLLIRVAERLRGTTRAGDTVARFGGDEFAVLLEDGADPFTSAQRIADALRTPFDVDRQFISVRVSIGVVELAPADARVNADELLARADTAMYTAKRSGKARIVGHHPGMSLVEHVGRRRLAVPPRDLAGADLAGGAIRPAYQPIIDLRTGRIAALEALARWQYEDADVLPSTASAAASTAVLPGLTATLLAEACAQLAVWSAGRSDSSRPLAVHVNVAPPQLNGDDFVELLCALVTEHRLRPGQLVLGLTESAATDLTSAQPVLTTLRRAGVAISLDEFGSGYSALSRLTDLELDSVRIPGSFLTRIETDQRQAALLRGLLRLARDLELPIIATDVERPSQLAELRRLGCPLAQGGLLGRPAFAATITGRLDLSRPVPSV